MYLTNFGTVIQKKRDKKIALISFYQFDKNIMAQNISVESICAADYFYDEDNHIEHMLSDKESVWSACFKEIINNSSRPLSLSQIKLLKEFATYQYMRTLGTNVHIKKMSRELYYSLIKEQFPDYPENVIQDAIRNRVDKEMTPDCQVEMAAPLTKEIEDLAIQIIVNTTEEPFITSDVPVIVTNAFANNGGGGISNIGSIMMYPISATFLVVIYDGKLYKNVPCQINDVDEIRKLNSYQVLSADERIISDNIEELKRYLEDQDLIRQRELVRNENVTTNAVSDDVPGAIVNVKSRNVPYIKLKMFTLPSEYKRIPSAAREVFPRAYNPKIREALLCRTVNIRAIYKEVLGNEVSNYDRKHIQNGYKELLDLYDEYWDVPISERIKPNQVKSEYKPNSANFYRIQN